MRIALLLLLLLAAAILVAHKTGIIQWEVGAALGVVVGLAAILSGIAKLMDWILRRSRN